MIILLERPIEIVSRSELAGVEGVVKEIGARRTTVMAHDQIAIFVPNQTFITDNVTNYMYCTNSPPGQARLEAQRHDLQDRGHVLPEARLSSARKKAPSRRRGASGGQCEGACRFHFDAGWKRWDAFREHFQRPLAPPGGCRWPSKYSWGDTSTNERCCLC